jgi:hypothetical protein
MCAGDNSLDLGDLGVDEDRLRQFNTTEKKGYHDNRNLHPQSEMAVSGLAGQDKPL